MLEISAIILLFTVGFVLGSNAMNAVYAAKVKKGMEPFIALDGSLQWRP